MTGQIIPLTMLDMAKRVGRPDGPATPTEFRQAFAERIRAARERAQMDQPTMARLLSDAAGRTIVPDTYRKYEKPGSGTLMALDLILPFCDITRVHPYELLKRTTEGESSDKGREAPSSKPREKRRARSLNV